MAPLCKVAKRSETECKAPLCKVAKRNRGQGSAKQTEGLFFLLFSRQPFHHFVVPLPLHREGSFRLPLHRGALMYVTSHFEFLIFSLDISEKICYNI